MWTRALLKRNAWNSLKGYYWTAFGVCLLAMFINSAVGGGSAMLDAPSFGMLQLDGALSYGDSYDSDMSNIAAAGVISMVYGMIYLFSFGLAILISTFLSNPLAVGQNKFFISAREGDVAFGNLFWNFTGGRYMKTVKVMFFQFLYTFLWSLLFVIPGIVKSYEYFLIQYLLAENPDLPKDRCFAISKAAMNGEKWNLFVLHLSFLGWILLGIMTCGIGLYFLMPYQNATFAEFYACMRAKIIAQGIATEEELSGVIM